jgi:hypothetical protein
MPIPDPIKPKDYLDQIAWETVVHDVVMLTEWTYRVTVKSRNIRDSGAGLIDVGYLLMDNNGERFEVTINNYGGISGNIIVNDIFETGRGPVAEKSGIIYKSIANGKSYWLSPSIYRRLDASAQDKSNNLAIEELYRNIGDTGVLFELESNHVVHYFENYYKIPPFGRSKIKCFRPDFDEMGDGALRDKDVPWQDLIVDEHHFELTIDQYEDLTGVVIEFDFKQRVIL